MKQPKTVVFKAEQDQLRKELLDILDLQSAPFNEDVLTITLHDLDKEDKRSSIMNLLPQVRRYFTITNKALLYPQETKRPHLTIVRFLLKDTYEMLGKYIEENGIKTMRYHFYHKKQQYK